MQTENADDRSRRDSECETYGLRRTLEGEPLEAVARMIETCILRPDHER